MQPNKTNLRTWVAALRSGEFLQGRGRLAKPLADGVTFEYCCLGVACELAAKVNDKIVVGMTKDSLGFPVRGYDDDYVVLPQSVREWLGVSEGTPDVEFGDRYVSLSSLNDDLCLTFAEIADLIEAHYKLLESNDAGQ